MKRITIILLLSSLLIACTTESKKEPNEDMIHNGFPEQITPATIEFFKQVITEHAHLNFLYETDDRYIFTKENVNSEQTDIQYVSLTKNDLEAFINEPSANQAESFQLTKEDIDAQLESINHENEGLPEITKHDDNTLAIETNVTEKEIDLPDLLAEYEINSTDELIINLEALTDEHMRINVFHLENKTHVSLFLNNNLENPVITQLFGNDLEETIQQEQLHSFEPLFNPNDQPLKKIGPTVWNTETNELLQIDDNDYLSDDGKYVYLNGKLDPIEEGEQTIQTITDYIEENDTTYAQFSLDYKALSKHLDRNSSGNVSISQVVYFAEDYIVLYANFKLPVVGTAGDTNIIIDLQEDKNNPTFYVVDLGLH